MGNSGNRNKKANETTTQTPTSPVMPSFSSEAPGSLAPVGNGAIAPSGKSGEGEDNRGGGRIEAKADNGLSEMTNALLEKADNLTRLINAKAQGRFEASEEWMMSLIEGDVSIPQLIQRYGLTDDVTAQQQLTELAQLGNSIRVSIAQKNVHILALDDQRKTYEIAEAEAKVATQVNNTANALDESRHSGVMLTLRSQIRAHKEAKKQADVVIEGHSAAKKKAKASQILTAIKSKQAGVKEPSQTSDRQTANANN